MTKEKATHDRILDIVVEKDEITWQNMIYELVKHENMNPWNVEVSRLADRYVQMLKKLKELDFRVSGKVLLAAAILLKIKSQKLLSDDMGELDRLMSPDPEMSEEEFYEDLEAQPGIREEEIPSLIPRTPQPRKRKVSIYDLMLALQKALEVRDRRILRQIPSVKVEMPEKQVDMSDLIGQLYKKIKECFESSQKVTFTQITTDMNKTKKIHNFLALLHLANIDQRKIDLIQSENLGEIEIVKANPEAAKAAEEERARLKEKQSVDETDGSQKQS